MSELMTQILEGAITQANVTNDAISKQLIFIDNLQARIKHLENHNTKLTIENEKLFDELEKLKREKSYGY